MKTEIKSSILSLVLATAFSFLIYSCDDIGADGNATDGSYLKIGNEIFQLDKGAFSLSEPNTWETNNIMVDHYYHDLVMYSENINIIKGKYGYDSIFTGNGGLFGCMVHPFDSTSIVGEYTFGSWDWDGDDATHGMPTKVTSDSTFYFGEMTLGSTLSIQIDADSTFTIAVDGFAKSWKDLDSVSIEVRYSGHLANSSVK